jgi:uncharacterized protein YjbI with pentapeptide repeats
MIVDIITSYVQRHCALDIRSQEGVRSVEPELVGLSQRALDAQAALTVLGKHGLSHDFKLRLADTDLRWSSIQGEFTTANLRGCRLDGAFMAYGDFTGARFARARLERADLEHAVLCGARFELADLRGAVLAHSDVGGAHFDRSDLSRADLRGVRNLQPDQLDRRQLDSAITEERVRSFSEQTRSTARELMSRATAMASAAPLSPEFVATLLTIANWDRQAVELATADCLRTQTDWIPRLRAARLLDQVLLKMSEPEAVPPMPHALMISRVVSGLQALQRSVRRVNALSNGGRDAMP